MNHITWIDQYHGRFEDEMFESICEYARLGFGQILSVKSLKEESE